MIYYYESEILRWVHECIPAIHQMTYAGDEELLTGMSNIKEFPSMYYSRTNMSIVWDKVIKVAPTMDFPRQYEFYPYEQTYIGTIIIENQQAAFRIMTTLKYFWNSKPYVEVNVPGLTEVTGEKLRVSLRLLSMSVEDVRLPNDVNGACRAVRFAWVSNLLMSNAPKDDIVLVEKVVLGYTLTDDFNVEEIHPVEGESETTWSSGYGHTDSEILNTIE